MCCVNYLEKNTCKVKDSLSYFRSSKSLLKGSTPKSSALLLQSSLLPLFKLSRLLPHRHLLQSLQQSSAQREGLITSLLVCWTMNTQQDQDLLGLEALEVVEPWPPACSSLHADLHCLRRTAALTRVPPLQV